MHAKCSPNFNSTTAVRNASNEGHKVSFIKLNSSNAQKINYPESKYHELSNRLHFIEVYQSNIPTRDVG